MNEVVKSRFRWQFYVQMSLIFVAVLAFASLVLWPFDTLFTFFIGLFTVLPAIYLFRNIKTTEIRDTQIVFRFVLTGKKRIVQFCDIKGSRIFHTRIQHKAGQTDPVENFEFKTTDGTVYGFSRTEYANYSQLKHTIYRKLKIIRPRVT